MSEEKFLLLNLALAFYNVGTIWAHEVDIFRNWQYLDAHTFKTIQDAHWRKLPYWVFIPVGLSFIGAVVLFWYRPVQISVAEAGAAFIVQLVSHVLTALCWGRWQAALSKDSLGAKSPYLTKILRTHWVRTVLISIYGLMLLYMAFQIL